VFTTSTPFVQFLLFGSFRIKRKVSEVSRVVVLRSRKYQSVHPEASDVFLTIHKRGVFEMHPIATSYSKQKLCSGELFLVGKSPIQSKNYVPGSLFGKSQSVE
jgi:hypothetical protein